MSEMRIRILLASAVALVVSGQSRRTQNSDRSIQLHAPSDF